MPLRRNYLKIIYKRSMDLNQTPVWEPVPLPLRPGWSFLHQVFMQIISGPNSVTCLSHWVTLAHGVCQSKLMTIELSALSERIFASIVNLPPKN
jgi:hypothetical protein